MRALLALLSRGRIGPTKTRSSVRVVSMLHAVVDEAFALTLIGKIKGMKFNSMDPEARMFWFTTPRSGSGGSGR